MSYLSHFGGFPTLRWTLSTLTVISLLATVCFFRQSVVTGATIEKTAAASASESVTVFSNPTPISPADRTSNNAGTNPGIPTSNYPSIITVSGLSGVVTKVTVTFAITSTFPDDLDILLVGPTGAMSLVMSDAGGSGDHTNVTFTFDQDAASTMPDAPTTPIPAGTFKPSNFVGLTAPEPNGQDNLPMAGGLMNYPTDFAIFNGTNPNGEWKLYVVDDQVIDTNSLPGGWSIDITTAIPVATASISGRVTSQSSGAGLGGVRVVLTGGGLATPRIAITNPFGYYRFDAVPQNQTYTATVASKVHQFSTSSQMVSLGTSDVANVNFTGTTP